MTVSIRIIREGAPTPGSGLAGALGGTTPSGSLELAVESDEFSDAEEARQFVTEALQLAALALRTAETGEQVSPALTEIRADDEQLDHADDRPEVGTPIIGAAEADVTLDYLKSVRLTKAAAALLHQTINERTI